MYIKNYKRPTRAVDPDTPSELSDTGLSRGMQKVMLPKRLPSLEGVDLGVYHTPGEQDGCDLFDIIPVSKDVYALLLFDVAGDGMRSTLISAMAKICFTKYICPDITPFTVLEHVNQDLQQAIGIDLKLSAFLGYLDLHDNELVFSSCGTISPMVYRHAGGEIESLYADTDYINSDTMQFFEEDSVFLNQGDALIVHTDGLRQLFATREWFREFPDFSAWLQKEQMSGFIRKIHEQCQEINSQKPIVDDITLIGVEILTLSRKNQLKEKLGFSKDDVVYLQFLNYLEEMDRAIGAVLSAMDGSGYPDEAIRKMKIVLTELLVNAVVHGNRRDYSKRVVIGHVIHREQVVVSIMDEGEGFDPANVPDPTLPENLERPCGRGIYIVRHYVETVTYNEIGNRVTVVKINELVSEGPLKPFSLV